MAALGTVAVAVIIAVLILMSLVVLIYVFSTSFSYVYGVAETSANRLENVLSVKLLIKSVMLKDSFTLCFNLTNEGSKHVILASGTLTLLDYVSTSSGRRILLLPYSRLVVSRVFIGNETLVVNESTATELMPGMIVELCTTVSDINVSNPLILVVSLPTGVKASRVTYLG